ncbi:MAG: GNAT family N-acetyltransferase, partial [Oscillospiraceae bacterium]|nr:GNAT family N-acetyltransferase [Oscillospiraceae bacterium]
MQFEIRPLTPEEYPILEDFLYEAIFIPEGIAPPPREIIRQPELQVYIREFGTSPHDRALGAIAEGRVVGAVWVRIMDDYGHVDAQTPSFA